MTMLASAPPESLMVLYLLLSLRFLGVLTAAPPLAGVALPVSARFLMAALLAFFTLPGTAPLPDVGALGSLPGMVLASGREFLLGSLFGFLVGAPLYMLQMTGRVVGMQMSFEMASVLDPFTQNQVSVVEQLHFVTGMWFFFLWDGHLLVLQGVAESLRLIPVGDLGLFPRSDMGLGLWLSQILGAAIRMALPFFGALLLADVGLGFVARTVPQMNIFVLGLPLKAGLGFFLLTVVLPMAVDTVHGMLDWTWRSALEALIGWR
ncbi:MAG TPA: flagellar biosynthetic protein FliR [Synergistaceae bacterium]|nr:flagellar biosynthetic protein FliR [Synergistaceae bacterium]